MAKPTIPKFLKDGKSLDDFIQSGIDSMNTLFETDDARAIGIAIYIVSDKVELSQTARLISDETTFEEYFEDE